MGLTYGLWFAVLVTWAQAQHGLPVPVRVTGRVVFKRLCRVGGLLLLRSSIWF